MKRKTKHYQLDKENILTSSGSFLSQRNSMADVDTKQIENEYMNVKRAEDLPTNEKLQFKKLEEESDM